MGLARCLGVSQGKTQHWEKGQWPKADGLALLAEKFGLDYKWLVTGTGSPYPAPAALVPATPDMTPLERELAAFEALMLKHGATSAEIKEGIKARFGSEARAGGGYGYGVTDRNRSDLKLHEPLPETPEPTGSQQK